MEAGGAVLLVSSLTFGDQQQADEHDWLFEYGYNHPSCSKDLLHRRRPRTGEEMSNGQGRMHDLDRWDPQ